ncbi:MAG: TetR/AcrR family transcriptional regulator [Proteobacteria bacterium]|nr:TetR/AcrR family transcriptional regulator [Pseudomonadota bacterium]
MPSEDRHSRRRDRTRARLVAAAREVMALKGLEATTIQDVTDAADVGKGSFYNHFDSKDAIARAAVEEIALHFAESLDRLADDLREDPARVIAIAIRHFLRKACEDPVLGHFVLRTPDAVAVIERVVGAYPRRDVGRGLETGRFREGGADVLTAILEGAIASVLRGRLAGALGAGADADLVVFVLKGLGIEDEEARAIAREPLPPLAD